MSACSKKAVIARIVSEAVGLIVADLIASSVFALIPRDLQRDSTFIDAVLKHPSTKGIDGFWGDMNCLINGSFSFVGDKDSGKRAPMDKNIGGDQDTSTTCPMIWLNGINRILEAGVLQKVIVFSVEATR